MIILMHAYRTFDKVNTHAQLKILRKVGIEGKFPQSEKKTLQNGQLPLYQMVKY